LDVIEIDAASNRRHRPDSRAARNGPLRARRGRYKVVILDEAHMLTPEASNALLKTLEEPPDKVIFVMATTEPENLAETIRSRSQHFHFRALSFAEIVDALEQICAKRKPDGGARRARRDGSRREGSLRDALSLLEQARATAHEHHRYASRELLGVVPEEILDELTGAIEARSAERVLTLVHRLLAEGQNLQHFCREAIGHFRNLLVARVCGADSALVAAPADQRPRLKQTAESFQRRRPHAIFPDSPATRTTICATSPMRDCIWRWACCVLVNAARLAPLEEILAELEGGAIRASSKFSFANASACTQQCPGWRSRHRIARIYAGSSTGFHERKNADYRGPAARNCCTSRGGSGVASRKRGP